MNKQDNEQSMTKKTLIYLAGNFSSKIFSVIIIPVYAKYLSASELGSYDYQQTIANLLMPVIALAIWESILRFGLKAGTQELNRILSTATIISFVTLTISFFVLSLIYSNLYGFNTLSFLYVTMIIFMPIVTILGYMTRAVKANKVFAISGIVSSIINMVGILIFVVGMNMGIYGLLISTIFSNIFNSLVLLIGANLTSHLKIKYFDFILGKELIKFSIPLIFNLVFGWFVNSFSRFYINLSLGSTANGIYAFGSKFSGILLQFAQIINMSAIEDAIISSNTNQFVSRFEKNIENITSLFFKICFVLMPVVAIYYNFINNKDFKSSLVLVPILLLVAILNNTSTLIGNIFPVFNKTSKAFVTSLAAGLTNVVFSVILGQYIGLIGVCLAQVISTITLVISRYIMGNQIVKYKVNWKKFISNSCIFLVISVVSILGNYIVQIVIFIITFVHLCIHYKNWIVYQVNKLLLKK